jgi:endogenous inhibitor of DNA gyrase (YacG/DUF329 family)
VIKTRKCDTCGATIVKTDTREVRLSTTIGSSLCPTCTKIMLGEDKPEYWTEVAE